MWGACHALASPAQGPLEAAVPCTRSAWEGAGFSGWAGAASKAAHEGRAKGMKSGSRASVTTILFSICCFSAFCVPLMLSAVGVALPTIGRNLAASALELGLTEQIYLLALTTTLLLFGRLGDIVGYGRIFSLGVLLFALSTIGCGFAPGMKWFLGMRFFQGLSASLSISVNMAIVTSLYPPEMRGQKLGFISGVIYGGISLGPLVGGFLTSNLGWRSIFWILGPLSLITAFFSFRYLWRHQGQSRGEKIDARGALVYGASIALFMIGASKGGSIWGMATMIAGLAGFFLFCRLEMRTPMPLLDIGMLRGNRYFLFSLLAAMGNYASTFGMIFFTSLYLQYVSGLSPRLAGVVLLIQPFLQMLLAPRFGRLADRMDPARLTNIGVIVITAILILMAATTSMTTPVWWIATELFFIGIGYGIFVVPNTVAIMGSVEKRQYGVASSLVGTVRTLGMMISMTCATLMLSLFMGEESVSPQTLPTFLLTMRVSLVIFAVFAVSGLVSSFARGRRAQAA